MKLFNIMDTAFNNFDTSVRTYLQKAFDTVGYQYTHSQVFGVIFDGIKGIMQNMMFYIEDAMNEQNIFTAYRKKSLYSLAKPSGYDAFYGSAASGVLISSMQIANELDSKTTKVYISNGCKLTNKANGFPYVIWLPTDSYVVDISKPLITHEFTVLQGKFFKSSYVSKGEVMETIHVNASELFDREYVKVTVDGEEWKAVPNLYDMTENSKEYILSIGYDNSFDIIFGNNINGKKLEEGQTVFIEYLAHNGEYGNIYPNERTDFRFSDNGYDTLGNPVDLNKYLILNVQSCISGGTNSDSVQFIRTMVGKNSRSLVLASEDNFKLFFKRFSFIGYVNCWSEQNSMTIITTCIRNLTKQIKDIEDYYKLKDEDYLLETREKEMIKNTLNNSQKSFAGITLEFKDPILRKFAFVCYVKVDSVYNKDIATHGIRKTLAKYFLNCLENVQFVSKSELIKRIHDENECIKAIDLDIISDLNEQCYKKGYYDKYVLQNINGKNKYVTKRVIYESETVPGLDNYGNIQLDSKFEIPIIQGGFNYYPNKDQGLKNDQIKIQDIQIFFI